MTTPFRQTTIIIFTVLLYSKSYAQDTITSNFYNQIKTYNLAKIWTAKSFLIEDGSEKVERAEILGFIGDNYQRFFIHINKVRRNPINPYEYIVSGKTKVRGIICSFQGKIKVKQARVYKIGDIPIYKQGFATCYVILYENKKQSSAGFIKGELKTNFLIDNKGQFRYDAISFVADGFSNNQFIGNWTSYKTYKTKKCNWGDYRIPECDWQNGCDIGAGEFSISDKYIKNGWENYRLAYGPDTPESVKARKKEDELWWK
jgi:hypothetical protein